MELTRSDTYLQENISEVQPGGHQWRGGDIQKEGVVLITDPVRNQVAGQWVG